MKIAYADPPYPNCAHLYKDHPDYAGEVDHHKLIERLDSEYDGWILHTSSPGLGYVLNAAHVADVSGFRIMAWVKPFAAYKKNVSVAYAWEPVLVKPCRKPVVTGELVMRDFLAEPIAMKKGLTGAKPPKVCRWLFHMVGAEIHDEMDDLYPGTGIVRATWDAWRTRENASQMALV